MNGDDFDPVVQIDDKKYTDTEKELLLKVVERDQLIRLQEKKRINNLKQELRNLREKGVPDGEEEFYGRVCSRCRTPLGLIINSGALCPSCQKKVCKTCRVPYQRDKDNLGWLCIYCGKIREIKAESGAWFYDHKEEKKKKAYGSFLIKRVFSRRTQKNDKAIFQDPDWSSIVDGDNDDDLENGNGQYAGYVLINQERNGEVTVKEGNLNDLLSNKAVLGLENAKILSKEEFKQIQNDDKVNEENQTKTASGREDKGNVPKKQSTLLSQSRDPTVTITDVGQKRRDSIDKELIILNKILDSGSKNDQKVELLDDEEICEKPMDARVELKKEESDEDDLNLDFKGMQKIGDISPHLDNGIALNDDDDDSLSDFRLVSKSSKLKFDKVRTEEHSDKEESSESDDEDGKCNHNFVNTGFAIRLFFLVKIGWEH